MKRFYQMFALVLCMAMAFTALECLSACDHNRDSGKDNSYDHVIEDNVCDHIVEDDGTLLYALNDSKTAYTVVGAKDEFAEELNIPNEHAGLPVTMIGIGTFKDHTAVQRVVVSSGIQEIGASAFQGCTSLTEVMLPNSLEKIGESAFYGCTSLAEIVLPNRVKYIKLGAFEFTAYYNDEKNWENDVLYIGAHLITARITSSDTYSIKAGTLTIANFAFNYCDSLTEVMFPDGLQVIGDDAFSMCRSLKEIALPQSVTEIGVWAFFGCRALEKITLGDRIARIGVWAFESTAAVENGRIDGAFYCGDYLIDATEVVGKYAVKAGTKLIAENAFYGAEELTKVTIPESVTVIGRQAFMDCSALESIAFPSRVSFIGEGVLGYCGALKSISVAKRNPLFHSAGNCLIDTENRVVMAGCNNSAIPADGSVTALGRHAFSARSFSEVVIPESVTKIGAYAFYECQALERVTLGGGVGAFGSFAFGYCTALTSFLYGGTKAEWDVISMQDEWHAWEFGTGEYEVTCTDGTFPRNKYELPHTDVW